MKITPKRKNARKAAAEGARQSRHQSSELQAVFDFFTNTRWFPVGGFVFPRAKVARYQTDKYGNRVKV